MSCSAIFAIKSGVEYEGDDGLRLIRTPLKRRAFDEITGRIDRFVEKRADWDSVKLGGDGDDGGEPDRGSYYIENAASVPGHDRYSKDPDDGSIDHKLVRRLVAIAFQLDGPGQSAVFVKKFTPTKIVTTKRKHFAFVSGAIDVQDGDVVDLPEWYDCCMYGDKTLIFHRSNFEDLFDYRERHILVHRQVFDHWEGVDFKIVDLDKYRTQTMNSPRKLRKFQSISAGAIWRWSFEQICRFLENHPVDGIKVEAETRQVWFKNDYALLHFFNDSHLASNATGRRYLATSKREEAARPAPPSGAPAGRQEAGH